MDVMGEGVGVGGVWQWTLYIQNRFFLAVIITPLISIKNSTNSFLSSDLKLETETKTWKFLASLIISVQVDQNRCCPCFQEQLAYEPFHFPL